ncbi:MAG: AAA family ATPase [Candidatus Bathyarchaeia archaeon]
MKIAVAGKGGVGKTLIAGTLARIYARKGYHVLAVDADPAMNLAYALGIPPEVSSNIVPVAENSSLIEERTGAKPGSAFGIFFSLTPTVDDIADKYGVVGPDGVKLLVMGTIRSGGSGCACPANSLLSALIRHITLRRGDIVIMDMEAGLEHLGRATARGFDALLCIVEPNAPSVETGIRIRRLAGEIEIREVLFIGNKISAGEEDYIRRALGEAGLELFHTVPFDQNIIRAGIMRIAPIDYSPRSPAILAIEELGEKLMGRLMANLTPTYKR